MFVFLELFDDIPRNRNVQHLAVVIPLQLDATVEVAIPVFDEFVLVFEAFFQMVDIVFVDIFQAKVSTTKMNDMGHVLCFHSPGICLHL